MTLTNTQKALLSILVVVLALSLIAAAWGVARWGFARSSKPDVARGITVSDTAEVKVQPDTAFITFGVVVRDRVAKLAAQENARRSSAVVAAIAKAGIPKSDIKTVDYSLEPQMNWDTNPPKITGYSASNTVSVRTKDMGKIGDLIDAAIAAGANNVQGVRFDVEDKRKLRQKALVLAVKKAEGKAQAIAEALGGKLGPAISASESIDEYAPYSRNYAMAYKMSAPEARTPISPGEASVSARVKVVYSIR
jgi:uncharacterized protein YggE